MLLGYMPSLGKGSKYTPENEYNSYKGKWKKVHVNLIQLICFKPYLSLGKHKICIILGTQASLLGLLQTLSAKSYCSKSSKLEREPIYRMPNLPSHPRDTKEVPLNDMGLNYMDRST